MAFNTIVGIFASILTGVALLPQMIKILKEKKADSISIGMLMLLFAGLAGWIYYGCLKNDWIIIVSNSFSLTINIIISILSAKYKKS
jgi:MtN3 and saliva related transmembrane protein